MSQSDAILKLLREWNDSNRAYPLDRTVENLFQIQAAKTPDAIAAIFGEEEVSYDELNRRANFLAYRLISLGVHPGDVVGLFFERSLDYLFALFAVLKVGAAFTPLDPDFPDSRLLYQIEDAGTVLVLGHSSLEKRLTSGKVQRIFVDKFNWAPADKKQKPFPVSSNVDSVFCVMYTSGSTGYPKGVEVPQLGVLNLLQWLQEENEISVGNRSLQLASISFDHSISEVFWPLINGATLILAKQGDHRNSLYIAETMKSQRVTHMATTPSVLRSLLEVPLFSECDDLEYVSCGGEELSVELNEKFHRTLSAELQNWYGPTETVVFSTVWKCVPRAKIISLGRPIANTQIFLLDPSCDSMDLMTSGEICIGGAGVAFGYRNLPEQTASSFVPNVFSEDKEQRIYRTGDLAQLHADGTLEYLGRKDQQIQLRGLRIEPGEIESLLNQHADVKESAVVLNEHGSNDARLHAYYVSGNSANDPGSHTLKEFLSTFLPEIMVPSFITSVDSIPRTVSGKLDRNRLKSDSSIQSPQNESASDPSIVDGVVRVFEEILRFGPVAETDSFFQLGGHSLLALQVRNKLNERFQVSLSMNIIFECDDVLLSVKI